MVMTDTRQQKVQCLETAKTLNRSTEV